MKNLLACFVIALSIAVSWNFLKTSELVTAEDAQAVEEQPTSYFFDQRAFPESRIDLAAYRAARLQVAQMKNTQSVSSPEWKQIGPYNIQGRVTDLAVDPRDDNVAFAAAADGGIFGTQDSGDTWIAISEDLPTMSMGAVASVSYTHLTLPTKA